MPLKMLMYYIKFDKEIDNEKLRLKVQNGVIDCINLETLVFKNDFNIFDDSFFIDNRLPIYY